MIVISDSIFNTKYSTITRSKNNKEQEREGKRTAVVYKNGLGP